MRVAVLVAGGLVETLQAAPLLGTLRVADPTSTITLLAPPPVEQVSTGLPGMDEIVTLTALRSGASRPDQWAAALLALRRRRLDAVLLCSTRPQDRVLAYLSGVARRAGLDTGPATRLLTARVPAPPGENRAEAFLRLAGAIGVEHRLRHPEYDPGETARRRAEEQLIGSGFEDGRLLIAVAPGAGYADPIPGTPSWALAWDPERFAHLANQLGSRHGAGVVVLGTRADREAADRMLDDVEAPTLDLCATLALDEAAAVIERCDLLISGESPLLHLAAAVGTPAIGLYGPTDGAARGPYGPGSRVVQGLGDTRTGPRMRRIRVDDVLAGIELPV
ncbi:MAG TPA: glycosyltransferase family 9 protein [Candidatus Dormibacteraeota bacterium]|nr:glycosyltransferase family 9 protein [Candidatus Dormibacteraeota bacterium]